MQNMEQIPMLNQCFWLLSLIFCYCIRWCSHSLGFDSHSSNTRLSSSRGTRCRRTPVGRATKTIAAARNGRISGPGQLTVNNVPNWCAVAPVDFAWAAAISWEEIAAALVKHVSVLAVRAGCAIAWTVSSSERVHLNGCCSPVGEER